MVDNTIDGFSLHQLDTGAYIRTFSTGTPIKGMPKQVAFGEACQIIVGGSDHSAVYVFDRRTGQRLDVLRHAETSVGEVWSGPVISPRM